MLGTGPAAPRCFPWTLLGGGPCPAFFGVATGGEAAGGKGGEESAKKRPPPTLLGALPADAASALAALQEAREEARDKDIQAYRAAPSYRDVDMEHGWKPRMEMYEHLWDKYADQERPQFLKALHINADGGTSAHDIDKLWAASTTIKLAKVCRGLQTFFLLFANTYFIVQWDMEVLMTPNREEDRRFLLCDGVWHYFRDSLGMEQMDHIYGKQLVVFIELGTLALLITKLMLLLHRAATAEKDCIRWRSWITIFWQVVPWLTTFSSMKLLYFVSQRVLSEDFYLQVVFFSERVAAGRQGRAAMKFGVFLVSRLLCLVVGFDALLVKLRLATTLVDTLYITPRQMLGILVFLFQLLGVIQVSIFIRKRLFIFIFGGEDGVVTTKEKAREYLWCSVMAKRLWSLHPPWLFVLLMVTFDDYDFQVLMLQERHHLTGRRSFTGSPHVSTEILPKKAASVG